MVTVGSTPAPSWTPPAKRKEEIKGRQTRIRTALFNIALPPDFN
jgi:hypothetical protein